MPEQDTALAVAAAVRSGATSARDAVAAALARIDADDARIGAFQVVRAQAAMAEAEAVDARPDRDQLPLAGVPVAVKDNVAVTGEPMRSGSAATDDAPRRTDHEVVRRLREAGAVVVGLTRVPELCVFGATDSVYGVTRNPWNTARTPGGSSGGSAAAVAAGMVPVAHGNDGMGSIRIPAACCGLVGLKPGSGVVPAGIGRNDWFGMAENGPLTTTVDDAALVLSVLAGRPPLAAVGDPDDGLRVAVSLAAPIPGVGVDPHHAAAVRGVADLLAAAGHRVDEVSVPAPTSAALAAFARWFAGTWEDAQGLDPRRLTRPVRRHAAIGRTVSRLGLVRDNGARAWQATAESFLAPFDLLLTPVLARPPIAARAWSTGSWASSMLANARYAPFSASWNLAGWPAASVPAGRHPQALTPLSVQLVTRPGGERLLLQVARLVEQQRPWQRHAPGYGPGR